MKTFKQIRGLVEAAVFATLMTVFVLMPLMAMPAEGAAAQQTSPTGPRKDYQQPFASAARGTTTSTSFQSYDANYVMAWLTVTAKGTGTSLDVKLQDSVDNVAFADIPGGAFTQVTGSTSAQRITVQAPPGRWVQVVATVGGGSTFTFHVELMFGRLDGSLNISSAADASTLVGTLNTNRLSQDVARTTSVTVTTAQVLALFTTPIALVPAQGVGVIVLIDEITAKLVFNTVAYTGANALEFRYTNGAGAKVTADIPSTFINSASGTNYATVKSVVTTLTPVDNAAVVVAVPSGNPAAGTSAIVFTVKYRIVTP